MIEGFRNKSLDHLQCSVYVLIVEHNWNGDMATQTRTKSSAKKSVAKHYLNVAYKDRDLAKRLGARWDPSVRRWYCPTGSPLFKIFSWRKASNTVNAEVAAASQAHVAMNENFDMFQMVS